jgi:hypothetical protein
MRGQTLVLFSLAMLLLTLMVLMTLGLGVRLHERAEQQTVADAAAYSEAVVTARTFNTVASLNRTLIAQMSAVAAAQSLLSWAGFYHGTLNQGRDLLIGMMKAGGPCAVELQQAHDAIIEEDRRLIDIWEPAGGGYEGVFGHDVKSAKYIRSSLYGTALLIADDQKRLYAQMLARVGSASQDNLANAIAAAARRGSPWGANEKELYAGDQFVTRREREDAVEPRQRAPKHMVRATMATRGTEHFLSSREGTARTHDLSAADYVARRLNAVMHARGSQLNAIVSDHGTSYFGEDGPQASSGLAEVEGYDGQALHRAAWLRWKDLADDGKKLVYRGAWAQDSGKFRFDWPSAPPGCKIPEPTEESFGYLVTTGPDDDNDNHMWQRGDPAVGDYRERNDPRVNNPPLTRHSFLERPQGAPRPSIWPVFVDYKESSLEGREAAANVDGQPKSLVPIVRDYGARQGRDPWELKFRFRVSDSGTGGPTMNLRADRKGMDEAIAIASALTYYHRGEADGRGPGHAREPPNFLNPFWRATLVASDVDEPFQRRGDDVIRTLEALDHKDQADALRMLREVRFEAIP